MSPPKKKKENLEQSQGTLKVVEFVSPQWLRKALQILPPVILVYALVMYILSLNIPPKVENRLDELQVTGFVAYAAILFLAQTALSKTSGVFIELWERNIFPKSDKARLAQFSKHLEGLANHNLWQAIFLLVALLIPLAGILRSCAEQNAVGLDLLFCNYDKGAIRTSKSVFEMVIGLFMILMAWRVFVAAWGIRKLGSEFDITPNWHHPDKSGGLLPVGTTSFWIASILAIPAIYLGTWQILCSGDGIEVCGNILRLDSRILYFRELSFVVVIASLISFVWPLWSVHQIMLKKRGKLQREELTVIGHKINEVSAQIIENVDKISDKSQQGQKALDENITLQKKLDALKKTYIDLEQLPVWPFNKDTIIQLISTQGIPLLGLTGIGSKALDFLKIIFRS